MENPKIEIAIIIDNKEYGIRFWPAVPRVGDEILIRRVDKENKIWPALVEKVVWGTSARSREYNRDRELRVSIGCSWIEE